MFMPEIRWTKGLEAVLPAIQFGETAISLLTVVAVSLLRIQLMGLELANLGCCRGMYRRNHQEAFASGDRKAAEVDKFRSL